MKWSTSQATSSPVTAGRDGCAVFQAVPVSAATITFSLGSNFSEVHGNQTEEVTFTNSGQATVHGANIVNREVCLTMPDGAANTGSSISWKGGSFTSDAQSVSLTNCATLHIPDSVQPDLSIVSNLLSASGINLRVTLNRSSVQLSGDQNVITIPPLPVVINRKVSVQMPDGSEVADAAITLKFITQSKSESSGGVPSVISTMSTGLRNQRCFSSYATSPWACILAKATGLDFSSDIHNLDNAYENAWAAKIENDALWKLTKWSNNSGSRAQVQTLQDEIHITYLNYISTFGGCKDNACQRWLNSVVRNRFLASTIQATVNYSMLGFTQNVTQDLVPGDNIIELPYMPRILDTPTSNLRFVANQPLRVTAKAVNAAGRPLANKTLSLASSASNTKSKTCKPSLSAKSNAQGKATFTLCLTKTSTLQVKGSGLVSSHKFTAIKR